MQLEHDFTVPVPPDEAWRVLLDVERVAPCMPGATLESFTGDDFTGKVKVKVGPIGVTYGGKGTFKDKDESSRTVTIEASGKEVRGQGTAKATVLCRLEDQGGETRVRVTTDLNVTGRPAQFGRGVMEDVGGKLIGRFATCLGEQLAGGSASGGSASDGSSSGAGAPAPRQPTLAPDEGRVASGGAVPSARAAPSPEGSDSASVGSAGTGAGASPPRWQPPRREAEPIDLLETAGLPVLKRLLPVVGGLALLGAVVWWWRHR